MGVRGDLFQGWWVRFRSAKGTWSLVILLALVYLIQLLMARSIQYGAVYTVAQEHVRSNLVIYILFSPLIHSNHGHILWNLALLAIGGFLVESWVGWRKLLAFVYGVGVLSNILPAVADFGGYGVGISGAIFGLWAFFGLTYYLICLRDWEETPRNLRGLAVHAPLAFLGMFYGATGIAQFLGYIPTSPGVARGAHLLGIIFGGFWFASREFGLEVDLNRIRRKA